MMPWFLDAQTSAIVEGARGYLWLLPVYAVTGMLPNLLRGKNDLNAWNLVRPMPTIVWIGVLLVFTVSGTANAVAVAQAYLVMLAMLALPMSFVVMRRLSGSFAPSTSMVRPMLGYGLPSVLSSVPSMLNLRLDQLLMAGLLRPKVLGMYVVAVAWSSAVLPLLNAIAGVVFPHVAGSHSNPDQAKVLGQVIRIGTVFAVLFSIGIALASPLIIPLLFGQEFVAAVPAAIILSLAGGVMGLNQILEAGSLGLGKPRFVLIAESAGLVVTGLLLWLLLRPFELMGAAVASLVGYTSVCVFLLWLIRRQTGLQIRQMVFPLSNDFDLALAKWREFRSVDTARGTKPDS
jgi:O-antigen/teichoic acid export membrane protein